VLVIVERTTARHQARLERRKRALQQLKDEGFAELEVELLDDVQEDDEIEKLLNDQEV